MRQTLQLVLYVAVATVLAAGCTGKRSQTARESDRHPQPTDTLYTAEKALMVYDYEPERALQIIDSAVIVGNVSDWWADKHRARIYSQTRAGSRLDSLMHWTEGTRFDSARAIGERLLLHDSIKNSLEGQQDVLEMLAYTARQQNDTTLWLQRSRQLVDVCRRQGAETEALRNEAEVGAALCHLGQPDEGMAVLDSVIVALSDRQPFKFNELDALIIVLRRKISALGTQGRQVETLPLARRVITLLDDYEQHPDRYHDGSYREPPAEKREDYIRFYRTQAENFVASAYAALGQTENMKATFERLENIVREADTREHQARYRALEQQMERQKAEARADRNQLLTVIFAILFAATLAALAWYWHQKHVISRKNRALVRQIEEAVKYKEKYMKAVPLLKQSTEPSDLSTLTDEQLFDYINHVIVSEQLYTNPNFSRQTLMDRFQLSKDRLGAAFSRGSEYAKLSDYIAELRLERAASLLIEEPNLTITQVAQACGFSTLRYFTDRFKHRFGMTPTDFRKAKR